MPVTHESVIFDVYDAKVYPLTADSGGSPTYGAAVDVPGIAAVSMDPEFSSAELKGDGGKVIASKGKASKLNLTATYGKLSLDVLEVLLESSVSDAGSTPNQHATWQLKGSNKTQYFKFEFKTDDVEVGLGSIRAKLYKCKITGGTLFTGTTDEFGQPTLEISAIAPDSSDIIGELIFDETLTALSA